MFALVLLSLDQFLSVLSLEQSWMFASSNEFTWLLLSRLVCLRSWPSNFMSWMNLELSCYESFSSDILFWSVLALYALNTLILEWIILICIRSRFLSYHCSALLFLSLLDRIWLCICWFLFYCARICSYALFCLPVLICIYLAHILEVLSEQDTERDI